MTLSQRIFITKGRSSGFDYIRLIMAVCVIVVHTIPICYGEDALRIVYMTSLRPLMFVIVPVFFVVGGFLVAASYERSNSIPVFLTLRAVRIIPALVCLILISTFVFGPILTNLSLLSYFGARATWTYLLGAFGLTQFVLPGVFSYNPSDSFNGSLWTISWELKCYLMLPILGMITILNRPRATVALAFALNVGMVIWALQMGHLDDWNKSGGGLLISCFFWGVALYVARDRIVYSSWLCAGAILFTYAALWWSPRAAYLAPLPLAYAAIYFGHLDPRRISLVKDRDLSYGIYLYGWPIQQAIVNLLPYGRVWYFNLPVSLVITTAVAWVSWKFVESNALDRKRQAVRIVAVFCGRFQRPWYKSPSAASRASGILSPGAARVPLMRDGQDAA